MINGMKMWKGNRNTSIFFFLLKGLERMVLLEVKCFVDGYILNQQGRGQMDTIMMSIVLQKSKDLLTGKILSNQSEEKKLKFQRRKDTKTDLKIEHFFILIRNNEGLSKKAEVN